MADETSDSDAVDCTGADAEEEARLEAAWDDADADPDLEEDLGYEAVSLDVLVTSNSDRKVMVLPRAEEWIRDDAYIVADFELACDPVEQA